MEERTPKEPDTNEPRKVGGKPPDLDEDETDAEDKSPADTPSEEIENPAEGEAPSG
jgi:hypothetical protein